MKKLFVCFVCVLLFGVFCGCAAEKTQTMNYEDIAVEMTALMYSGDYEGAAEFISKDAVGGLDASALEQNSHWAHLRFTAITLALWESRKLPLRNTRNIWDSAVILIPRVMTMSFILKVFPL